jgi:hypothetical protein
VCPSQQKVDWFSVATTSGLYSTVAGVMAGFAFAAVFFMITDVRRVGSATVRDVAAQALSAAFLALLLSAVCWAIVAGEKETAGRAATIEVFAGCGFALAAVQLFYSLMLLIEARAQVGQPLHRYFRLAGGAFLCPAAFGLAALGVTDYAETSEGAAGTWTLGVAVALLGALLLLVGWLALPEPREGPKSITSVTVFPRRWHPSQRVFRRELPMLLNPSWTTVALGTLALVLTSAFDGLADHCSPGSLAFVSSEPFPYGSCPCKRGRAVLSSARTPPDTVDESDRNMIVASDLATTILAIASVVVAGVAMATARAAHRLNARLETTRRRREYSTWSVAMIPRLHAALGNPDPEVPTGLRTVLVELLEAANAAWRDARIGLLASDWDGHREPFEAWMRTPAARDAWPIIRRHWEPEFRKYVDGVCATQEQGASGSSNSEP